MKRLGILVSSFSILTSSFAAEQRPNILFFFVDDWGRYAGIYADPQQPSLNDIVKTPNLDRIGREGVVFENVFVPVSSCGPCRASLATGHYFWNCGSGAFLNGKASDWKGHENPFPAMTKFPDLLRESGYFARKQVKTIAFVDSKPTPVEKGMQRVEYQRYGLYVSEAKDDADRVKRIEETLNHPRYEMRRVVKAAQSVEQPFFFIYGTINVHRPYTPDSGQKLWGINPESLRGRLPKFLPDVEEARHDFADYLGEVQAADAMLGVMLDELEKAGQLDNTLVIISGDNGIPGIPRGKTNCYDLSVRAPMMVRWPGKVQASRRVEDFVSVMDVGPTLLEVAGLPVPAEMNGRSFLAQLTSPNSGWIDKKRDWVVVGRELHFHTARDGNLPFPMRAIRTRDNLYIRNFKPDRWPNGAPYNLTEKSKTDDYANLEDAPYRDLDASLTKSWLIENRLSTDAKDTMELTLGKRPPEELYEIHDDPDSLHNLAGQADSESTLIRLRTQLDALMQETKDPRLTDAFDKPPYLVNTTTPPKTMRKAGKAAKKDQ